MHVISPAGLLIILILSWQLPTGPAVSAEDLFQDRIQPALTKYCYQCHSHASGRMKGSLTLDSRSGWATGGGSGPAIVPGNANESLLIEAIRYQGLEMPPDERLPDEVIADFVAWVEAGAPDPRIHETEPVLADTDFWSLRPLQLPAIPEIAEHPVDAFIEQRLAAAGLNLSPPADRRTLIRRLYFDLLGLQPTPEEVEQFEADSSPLAWEQLVDRTLTSLRYGERWARHWLDTVHFADSHGYEHDVGRDHAWRYRDYVIDSFNRDTPWPQRIRQQLAADVFFPDQSHLVPALGFLGAGTWDLSTYSTATVTFDYLDRDDLVTQTMTAFTSSTIHCARCHAHKFDPVPQEDYYAVQAVFAGILKGNLEFDPDPDLSRQRRRWQDLKAAAEDRNRDVLLHLDQQALVEDWLTSAGKRAEWHTLHPETFLAFNGTSLQRQPDASLLAAGDRPDRDTYLTTSGIPLPVVTAVRLDVLAHESLPLQGPGRQDNGNFHLSEIEVRLFDPDKAESSELQFSRATADFEQSGWESSKAIDKDKATAWGIFPAVGQSHFAVFELTEPVRITPESRLTVSLRQMHGGGHLIGAFRLSVTADDPAAAAALPAAAEQALTIPAQQRTESQWLELNSSVLKTVAQQQLAQLPEPALVYAAAPRVRIVDGNAKPNLKQIERPRVVHLLQRGDFNQPRSEVPPGALSALEHLPPRFDLENPDQEASRRAALADWLAHPENSLTWRSVVNRVWNYHFGHGLCRTPNDFGRMGDEPSHPELLDWLAVWFRDEANASLKQLHRLIVTSRVYRQSSEIRREGQELDNENRLLWRQFRQRLDADACRDAIMSVAGTLDLTMSGPGVRHFSESPGRQLTPVLNYSDYDWNQPGATRRSIYRFVWRGIADPFMEALDFPDLGQQAPIRTFSASSLQALMLFNNRFVQHHSNVLAERAESEYQDPQDRIRRVVLLVWLREPQPEELAEFSSFVQQHGLPALCRLLLNSNEFLFVD